MIKYIRDKYLIFYFPLLQKFHVDFNTENVSSVTEIKMAEKSKNFCYLIFRKEKKTTEVYSHEREKASWRKEGLLQ